MNADSTHGKENVGRSDSNTTSFTSASADGTTVLMDDDNDDDDDLENGIKRFGPCFKLRGLNDDLPQKWWFASTAIPLLAATTGPLSNVLSIASIVTPWKVALPNNGRLPEGADNNGVGLKDPTWEITLNACSLACGFIGNFFLLFNFTGRVRYIVSLPMSIIAWFMASGILIGITASMEIYIPPVGPGEIYSQGFWHAVFAGALYLIGAAMLMLNMLGYILGYYPQHFDLDYDQRTLILQTIMFFAWLAGGAAVFAKLEGWTYANALYWADVSILTIGFGDMAPMTTGGRVFLFVYEVIGIIFLGLVISSITRFVASISVDKVIKRHQRLARENTLGRTVTNERELRMRLGLPLRRRSTIGKGRRESLSSYGNLQIRGRKVVFNRTANQHPHIATDPNHTSAIFRKKQKLLLLREEEDRFDLMREIQAKTRRFKKYWALSMAIIAFLILWMVGATVFMVVEHRLQQYSFFDALYFAFVALLTIGYGDMNPSSNVGKPFFVIWSVVAVPTMTVFIQEMSSTVVSAVNKGTFKVADWTILPKKGIMRKFLGDHAKKKGGFLSWITRIKAERGLDAGGPRGSSATPTTGNDNVNSINAEKEKESVLRRLADRSSNAIPSQHELARELAKAIKKVSRDLQSGEKKRYTYPEWVHFTKLIRFSHHGEHGGGLEEEEDERGLVEWDWLGEDSPMVDDCGEPAWVLERLCESLGRYTKRLAKGPPEQPQTGQPPNRPETIHEMSDEEDEDADVFFPGPTSPEPPVLRMPSWGPDQTKKRKRRATTSEVPAQGQSQSQTQARPAASCSQRPA